MSTRTEQTAAASSDGCFPLVSTIFLAYALFWSVPTPWGCFTYDLFWPSVQNTCPVEAPVVAPVPKEAP